MLPNQKIIKKFFNQKTAVSALFVFCAAVVFLIPFVAAAQVDMQTDLQPIQEQTGLPTGDIRVIIAKIIRIILGFIGLIAICIVLYAGYLWMTSGGDPTKVGKAKKWLINGVIGLLIIFSSYSIVSFILSRLLAITHGIPIVSSTEDAVIDVGGGGLGGGALGKVVADHWPGRNATDVARNTNIMVRFGTAFDPYSILKTDDNLKCEEKTICGRLNYNNIKIYLLKDQEKNQWPQDDAKLIKDGMVTVSEDHKIFVFNPYNPEDPKKYLGSSTEDVSYVVYLTQNILKQGSKKTIFESNAPDYAWMFTTGTTIDQTPPYVKSVVPLGPDKVARNYIVQMNFSEPIIPPFHQTASGTGADADNEIYLKTSSGYISGNFKVGLNGFRTVEFITDKECEGVKVNSCGEKIYCLPADATIGVTIKAGQLSNEPPMALFPPKGIVDGAGNSLDGNHNGVSEGQPNDNYNWLFSTSGEIDVIPPIIDELSPNLNAGNVDPTAIVSIFFDSAMSTDSLFGNVILKGDQWEKWYSIKVEDREKQGKIITSARINIQHGDFDKAPEKKPTFKYYSIVTNGVRDLLQNCYRPCKGPNCLNTAASCCPDPKTGICKPELVAGCGL
ncbi:TrbC/VirB2 family protein [Candidatus Falkowbacteria bacterium]|nr:TrbC/VirB2 family protein [Candidatus Falkowbacteria bacterium]